MYLYHPGTENAVEGKIKGLFSWVMGKRDEKKRFEYVLGVLCREPSFFPADSLEGKETLFTRKKSEEIGKNAENRRKMQTRKGA